jgi:predicted hydrocarbon binding protein
MEFLDAHPVLARTFLSPIARAPILGRRLPVLPRAFMGATAFEIHDVEVARGRIGIGGVDEVLFSSKFLEAFHRLIAEEIGSVERKNDVLYRIGKDGGQWEVREALSHGRWGPRPLVQLIESGTAAQSLQSDPQMERFFQAVMKMVCRIIINEGGWGSVEKIDLRSNPMQLVLANSNEARWVGPSESPVCFICAGVVAGYASGIFRRDVDAKEVECAAMGSSHCTFELTFE